ncbi:MAG: diguanylate cyclase [Sphingomonas bacterium]|uniref:sensor domain-containing diguanylate cyclase n=1 Tax=Sphingomonas bacterium TaxID=1895847 RepID=UPI002622DC6A|nr:diguanylate cyclase [Sphingomonas bacterium]MDB5705100.1 diguanylate cyclase [Sphingomonas bacterium]
MSLEWIRRAAEVRTPSGVGPGPAPCAGSHGLLDRAAALAGIGAWSCDLADDTLSWTACTYDLFGLPRDAKIDRREAVAMYTEESRAAMERLRMDAIAHRRPFTLDAQIVRADGALRWMRLTADVVYDGRRPVQLYGLKQDITEERARWETMRRQAEQDPLTGLASRHVFQSRFLDRDPTLAPPGALILFDVDGFKQINDRYGHAAGDACLQSVADRLCAGFHDALMVARIGGDEFAVLIAPGREAAASQDRVARELVRLSAPIVWRGALLKVSASAGIAEAGDPLAYNAEALFAAADAALYAAKHAGRNRACKATAEVPHAFYMTG